MIDGTRRPLLGFVLAKTATVANPVQALECPDRLGIYRSTTTTNKLRFSASIQSVSIARVPFTKA